MNKIALITGITGFLRTYPGIGQREIEYTMSLINNLNRPEPISGKACKKPSPGIGKKGCALPALIKTLNLKT